MDLKIKISRLVMQEVSLWNSFLTVFA